MLIEILGVIGFGFLIISFMQKDVNKLRILNCCGGFFLIIQAYLIGVWSLILINGSIAIINIYHLINDRNKSK